MARHVWYEWDIETTDEYGDIIDHDFSDQCPSRKLDKHETLVLVKSYSDPAGMYVQDRTCAYIINGSLPEEFEDGSKITKAHQKAFKARRET